MDKALVKSDADFYPWNNNDDNDDQYEIDYGDVENHHHGNFHDIDDIFINDYNNSNNSNNNNDNKSNSLMSSLTSSTFLSSFLNIENNNVNMEYNNNNNDNNNNNNNNNNIIINYDVNINDTLTTTSLTDLAAGGVLSVDDGLDWHAIAVIVIVSLGTVCNILAFRTMSCPSMAFLNAYFYLKGEFCFCFESSLASCSLPNA